MSARPPQTPRPRTWRTVLRLALQLGFPLVGIVVIARAAVASIGGEIAPARFALGLLLIVLTVSARLVPGR